MATEQIELLEELSGGRLYSSAILSTYGFDGAFFENEILPVLNQLDVTNIVVLTDTESYRSANAITQAGQAYYIDRVQCPKIHHPKFVALFGRDYGRILVGSANLTELGWQQSGELMTVIDYPAESGSAETTHLFAQLRKFIEYSQTRIHSSHAIDAIDDAFSDAPWLPEPTTTESESEVNLIHNYAEPLLSQVSEYIGNRSIEQIDICSPFFSGGNIEPFEELCELNPERISINIQRDKVEGFKSGVFDAPQFADIDVTVNEIEMTGDDVDRYLHAKLLLLTGPDGAWAFYGSPNFTKPALLQTADVGNVELGVLRYEPDPEYFGYLFDDEIITRESISPDSVKYHPPDSDDSGEQKPDFQLADAHFETDGTLIITYDTSKEPPQEATITLHRATGDQELDKEITSPEEGRLKKKDDEISQFCEQAVQVQVTLKFTAETLTSDARWVSSPSLKHKPRPSEIKAIETSEGREELLDVLDRLPTWGLICEFLENIEFGTTTPGRGGGTVRVNDPNTDDDNGMEEWSPTNRDELLERKVRTLKNKIEATHNDLVFNPTDPERFESLVNQYVALSKLILWWESQDLSTLPHISKIRVPTQTIGEFVNMLATHEQVKTAQALEEENALFEHTAISIQYVDKLQRRAGYNSGANQNVYKVFQDTNRDVIEAFVDLRGEPAPDHERIADIIDEYDAIDAVSVTPSQVIQSCKELNGASV